MADFEVSIGAKLGDALNNLAKLRDEGKITDKQFAQASKTIEKGFAAQSREAKKLAALLKKDVGKDGKAAFDALKNAAEGFGGKIGGSVAMVEKFGKAAASIAGPLGPIAGVAVAGGLALGGLGVAAFKAGEMLIAAADASADFARAHANMLDPETTAALLSMDDATDTARLSWQAASATLVGEFAPSLEQAAVVVQKLGYVVRDSSDEIIAALDGIVLAAELVIAPTRTIAAMFGLAERPTAAFSGALEALDRVTASYDEEARKATETTKSLRKESVDAAKAMEEANKRYFDEWMKNEEEKKAFSEGVMKLVDEQQTAEDKYFADWMAREAEKVALREGVMKLVEEDAKAVEKAEEDKRAAIERTIAVTQAALSNAISGFSAFAEVARATAESKLEATEAAMEAALARGDVATANSLKARADAEEKAILKAFAAKKGLSISDAIINGAVAATLVLASVPPPFSMPAVAAVGTSVAGQIALIASQEPPTFATGGMVGDKVDGDHVTIAASRKEAVLTERGVQSAGGPTGVADLNRGAVAPPMVQVYIDGEMVARAITSKPGTAKAVARALSPWLAGRGF